ncbi:hypothetical protein K9U39_12050 [Rhodoblastus acidophilus]|uniref:Uncharacterized protein n=1 Tax=Candidatus Rhodoblastus alkanivorans TaxID=2954117 RepID=A0ABS9Z9V2_9HYPH|nr:hypothetical protein [Candidatus Rhodoblastus alkanivorans]MCI4679835.1 hypothetical protein [Candidatus Rhodoblastus alkanivorans]MCI4684341.1 hypothetical protein [Candidatus Rhodoblastus alkanivorans]MDI4641662.1 hypothetical protein [Rhodoblastus acidophilus]
MRYILAAIILCALVPLGATAASAKSSHASAKVKREASAHTARKGRPAASRHGRGLGGIHPLVGSGDY